jgi:hypothetical protein
MNDFKITASYNFFDKLVPQQSFLGLEDHNFNNGQLFGLQNGLAGKFLGLIEIYKLTNNQLLLYLADQLYLNLLEHWDPALQNWSNHEMHIKDVEQHYEHIRQFQENNEAFFRATAGLDHSFETGTAGIAYALLRYEQLTGKTSSEEKNIPVNELLPKEAVDIQVEINDEILQDLIGFNAIHLGHIWIEKWFPGILRLDENQKLQAFSFDIQGTHFSNYDTFHNQLDAHIRSVVLPGLELEKREELTRTFEYEHAKNQLLLAVDNRAFERARELYINTTLPDILSLDNEALFSSIRCQMNQNLDLLEREESLFIILLYLTDGVVDIEINTFEYIFLSYYESTKTGVEVLEAMSKEQDIDAQSDVIRRKATSFLRKMIFLKVLIPNENRK